jgi:hypothetical protein
MKYFFQTFLRIVVAIDLSTSMSIADRFVNVVKSASTFLQSASIGTYIGMISFHKNVQIRSNLVEVKDDDTRAVLIERLPEINQFGRGTSLGGAVQGKLE